MIEKDESGKNQKSLDIPKLVAFLSLDKTYKPIDTNPINLKIGELLDIHAEDDKKTKEFCEEYERVEEIFQNEYGITTSEAQKSVLATYGLCNCVGIAGYAEIETPEGKKNVGFLTHYQHNTNIDMAFGLLLYNLQKITKGRKVCFKTKIVGGIKNMSEHLVDKLRQKLRMSTEGISFENIGEEVLISGVGGQDLVLDVTNGQFYNKYRPLNNPHHRPAIEDWKKNLVAQTQTPYLYYFHE